MVTPRTRRTAPPLEVGKDSTKTKVVIPEGTTVEVLEHQGNKTMTYQAEIKEDDTNDETETNGRLNDIEDYSGIDEMPNTPTIPKSQLDIMFDDINYAVENENLYDTFFAKLMRQPDAISDKFIVPNRDIVELGVIQFSTQDRFNFIPAIQDANNNSGGRFAITIYNSDYKQLEVMRGRVSIHAEPRPVGLILVVPNPQPKATNSLATGNAPDVGTSAILSKMVEIQQQNHNQLMQVLNRKPEKSTLELAIEQKVLNDILNPPKPNNGGNDVVADVMRSAAVVASLSDAFARNLNREPTPQPEPDWIDKFNKASENPVMKEIAERGITLFENIGNHLAVKALNLPTDGEATTTENPMQQQPQQLTQTQELILDIIEELESDNALDATNETIKELSTDFPEQYQELTMFCKNASFEFIFDQLLKRTANIQPSPFIPYLDLNETNAQQKYVWNETGIKLQGRLRELYEYLKTV